MSLLDTWIRRERAPVALQLIFGFGCRVKAVDLFIDLLVDLTHDKRGNVARSGLEALTRLGLRKRAAELIPDWCGTIRAGSRFQRCPGICICTGRTC